MRYITEEYKKILESLSPRERDEAIKVLEDVSKEGCASAFSAGCRKTADALTDSLKYHWKTWLKSLYITIVCLSTLAFFRESVAQAIGKHVLRGWLAEYYYFNIEGEGFFGAVISVVFSSIGYALYFYLLAWVFTGILKVMAAITRGSEETWNRRRNLLFTYLDERDAYAEAHDPQFWYAPREEAEMKSFAEKNPNYHAARGRIWANKV